MTEVPPIAATLNPLDSDLTGKIIASVKNGLGAQLEFTKELVRCPSVRGQEHTAQDLLFQAMKSRGLVMDRWSIDVNDIQSHPGFSQVSVSYDNAINVVGTHRPREEKGRSLILNGHVDVVPVGPLDMWELSTEL